MKKAGHNDWSAVNPGPNAPKQPIPVPKDQRHVLGQPTKKGNVMDCRSCPCGAKARFCVNDTLGTSFREFDLCGYCCKIEIERRGGFSKWVSGGFDVVSRKLFTPPFSVSCNLVPSREGAEMVETIGSGYDERGTEHIADIKTGWDPLADHNYQYDGRRYAIALAQMREEKDYDSFDVARHSLGLGRYRVDALKDGVRVVYESTRDKKLRKKKNRKRKRNNKLDGS